MKMNHLTVSMCLAATLALAAVARAESPQGSWRTRDPGVNARQENQQDRIAQGIHSGELTPREVRILEAKEARFNRLERRLKSDGTLSPADRARLQRRLDVMSRDIYRLKHNAQETPPAK